MAAFERRIINKIPVDAMKTGAGMTIQHSVIEK
jgi:hypothetical protein